MLREVYLRYLRVKLFHSLQKVTISTTDSNNIQFLIEIKNYCVDVLPLKLLFILMFVYTTLKNTLTLEISHALVTDILNNDIFLLGNFTFRIDV